MDRWGRNQRLRWNIHEEYCGKAMQGTVIAGFGDWFIHAAGNSRLNEYIH